MNGYMQLILLIIATILPGYVIGGVNGAIIVSKLFYRKDIREYGSKNPGLTNFYRVFGKGGTIPVILIDVLKTVAPVLFGGWLFSYYIDILPEAATLSDMFVSEVLFGRVVAGFAVIMGHCFPLFHSFKGGKGVMAIGALVIFMDWPVAIVAWGLFLLIAITTRYVSLGAVIGVISIPLTMLIFGIGGTCELVVSTLCILLVIFRHSGNIKRLIRGEESKLSLERKKTEPDNDGLKQEREQ